MAATYTVNTLNQYTTVSTVSGVSPSYDGDGNLTGDAPGPTNTIRRTG